MTGEIVFRAFGRKLLEEIGRENVKPVDAVPTPFPSWNRSCGEEGGRQGLAKGWTVVAAGTPGSGKSTLAINLAAHAVMKGYRVGDINFEMSHTQLAGRYLSILTGLPRAYFERGPTYSETKWDEAIHKAEIIYEQTGGVFISNQEAVFRLDEIRRSYETLAEHDVDLVLVDYAQLIEVPGADGIYMRTDAIANTLRALSRDFNVATLALAQFNRDTSKRRDARPTKEGISGGASWENNANQIWLLDHSYRSYHPETRTERTRLICDKNRHGLFPFRIPIEWDWTTGRCEEVPEGMSDSRSPGEEYEAVAADDPEPSEQLDFRRTAP